jgi:glycosyltransferase involved in cell wall biosynthesis
MKVAVIVTGGLHPSGREQVVPSWLTLFSELATTHEVHAFVLRHLPEARSYTLLGFHVHDLGRPSAPLGLSRWVQERALAAAMSAHGRFDVIHGIWGDPAGQLAVRMGKRFSRPAVATFDSGEFESMPAIEYGSQRTSRGRAAIAEALTASRLHVCSEFMAVRTRQHGVTPIVIPLTTVTGTATGGSRLSASAADRPLRRDLAEARIASVGGPAPGSRQLQLLQVATLSRVKNQRLLIDALARVAPAIDARLDLVGEDTLGGELQRHATTTGVGNRVRFHGFRTRAELAPFYAAADIYVQSSLHEAAGVSVLEAAAAGVPVIGTRAGYVADWAPDRATAVDSPNANAMADAIVAMHRDPTRAGSMSATARAWALERDASWVAARFENLYRETAVRS